MNYTVPAHNTHDDDSDYLMALAFRFRSATTIKARMAAAGVPVSLDAIRTKMTEFVEETGMVEAKGDSWRIVPTPLPHNAIVPMIAANDDLAAIPTTTAPLLVKGDGLSMMRGLPDKSVHLISCDLPYGMTGLSIDPKINIDAWMSEMARIVTPNGVIVAFSAQPFTTDLIVASRKFDKGKQAFLKQEVIWHKTMATGFTHSHARRLKAHENILIFSHGSAIGGKRAKCPMVYNPQGVIETIKENRRKGEINFLGNSVCGHKPGEKHRSLKNCPRSVLFGGKDSHSMKLHPFAKPEWLLEDMIRTYSNPGDVVLDPTMGSGSAVVAAINTGRRSIGAENGKDKKGRCIFTIAETRIAETMSAKVVA